MNTLRSIGRATGIAAAGLALALSTQLAVAAGSSPVGVWKTIDDKTGQAKSLVQITESGGRLHGRVTRIFNPSKPNPTCDKCEGDKKGQPITGMEILWGLKQDGDVWSGGRVLDPQNGKVYDAKLSLSDNGNKLNLRGFIGFSLLGRTQTWLRETEPAQATESTTTP